MGNKEVFASRDPGARARSGAAIVDDLDALEQMLALGAFDSGPPRIGAEQEMLLIGRGLCPAPVMETLMRSLGDPRFTSELALFNLEANLTPRFLAGPSMRALQHELSELTATARAAARRIDVDVLLAGYLPTYDPCIANLEHMVQEPRYAAVNYETLSARGGNLQLVIHGRDTLEVAHDNIMLEGGATSFQVHLQVSPKAFAAAYNCALLTAAPMIAACANSPLLFSHRLWHESRVPLLEASGDVRSTGQLRRPGSSRTGLGDRWVQRSPVEIFRRDLCRFEPMFSVDDGIRSTDEVRAGRIPALRALTTFNGTVWRWMRPCYGVTDGRPHIRIENRLLPAGPTVIDEVANAALWLGLMSAMPPRLQSALPDLAFEAAEENLHAAARSGLDASLTWLGGERVVARDLLGGTLIPLAREGLRDAGVEPDDIDRYLGIIACRVESGQTGARWALDAFDGFPKDIPPRQRSWRLTGALTRLCWSGGPVHEWPRCLPDIAPSVIPPISVVLRTSFIALPPEAPAVLAEKQLEWSGTSHIVVETSEGHFVALLSATEMNGYRARFGELATVGQLLPSTFAIALSPELGSDDALAQLQLANQAAGVVLHGKHAAGIVLVEDLGNALSGAPAPTPQGEMEVAC
jgi:hypothetical protein